MDEMAQVRDSIFKLSDAISTKKNIRIMEVCGTHTMSIARFGLHQILPSKIDLISGPGCPVCVTPLSDIDWIINIINKEDFTTYTFGDLLRVPGSDSSLKIEKSRGAQIKICYSPLEALAFAEKNRSKKVLFIAIGFETTAPITAVLIKRAYEKKLNNFFIFSTHKIVPPALEALLKDKDIKINGFLLPGHVCAITGTKPFSFIPDIYGIPCVISGFEASDILSAINSILYQMYKCDPKVEIEYKRVVNESGNPNAIKQIYDVFDTGDCNWRSIGTIPGSGLILKEKYSVFDIKRMFPAPEVKEKEPAGCLCGQVLKGIKKPYECRLFIKKCNPDTPVGPCMVSSEGSCAAYFKYRKQ